VIQDEITLEITKAMQIELAEGGQTRAYSKGTKNLSAYMKYLEVRESIYAMNKTDNDFARQSLEEIVLLDPDWPLGYAALAGTHVSDCFGGWSDSLDWSIAEAVRLVEKSLSLDASWAGAYSVLCLINIIKKQYDEAITNAEKSVTLQPNYWLGYANWGFALIVSGVPNEAVQMCKKAVRISPFNLLPVYYLGVAYCHCGQYSAAAKALMRAVERKPDSFLANTYLTATYSLANRENEVRKQVGEVLLIDPNFSVAKFENHLFFKNQADADRILNALRKAGLK